MSDLVAFLNARLDEDEAAANAALGSDWTAQDPDDDEADRVWVSGDRGLVCRAGFATAAHIVRHDPARVLREIQAKRKILERHSPHETAFDGLACNWCSEDVDDRPQLAKERWPCGDVRALAAIYADSPDYQEEWNAPPEPA